MSDPKTIQDELRQLESNLPLTNSPVFSVPEGYFEGLAERMLSKVKSDEPSLVEAELEALSPLLAGIPKTTPYSVPSFYFQENLEAASGFQNEADSPVLRGVGKTLLYEAPAGYFESLSEQVLAKLAPPKPKVVPLFGRKWMRVASAAVVAGALFLVGLQLFNNKMESVSLANNADPTDTTTLIAKTLPAVEQDIKKVPTKELEQFIESVPLPATVSKPKKEMALAEQEAETLLEDVSVNEMESFLSTLPLTEDEIGGTD